MLQVASTCLGPVFEQSGLCGRWGCALFVTLLDQEESDVNLNKFFGMSLKAVQALLS